MRTVINSVLGLSLLNGVSELFVSMSVDDWVKLICNVVIASVTVYKLLKDKKKRKTNGKYRTQ